MLRLSVALCTYNGEKYIQEQIGSIIHQSVKVDEIVVCDDGSNDETLNIVYALADKYNDIKWNIQKNEANLGVIRNFEKAIKLCTGDIIFLSDQDDVWYPLKTKTIIDYFESHENVDVVFTDADLIDGEGKKLTDYSLLDSVCLLPNINLWNEGFQFEILNYQNKVTGATMAVRKDFTNKVLPFVEEEKCLHDEQLSICGCLCTSLHLLPERLIGYRQHGNNVIGVNKTNWIYTNGAPPSLFNAIIDPYPTKLYMRKFENNRFRLYEQRLNRKFGVMGAIRIILSLTSYFEFYKRFAIRIILHDLKKCFQKND